VVIVPGLDYFHGTLSDLHGKEIKTKWHKTGSNSWQISGLHKGVYFLSIAGQRPEKLVVLK